MTEQRNITLINSNGIATRVFEDDPEYEDTATLQARILERQAKTVRAKPRQGATAEAKTQASLNADAVKMFRLLRDSDLLHLLIAIAEAGGRRIAQVDLLRQMGMSPYDLRARLGGLATHAKHAGIAYPVRSDGTKLQNRRFWLEPDFAATLMTLKRSMRS